MGTLGAFSSSNAAETNGLSFTNFFLFRPAEAEASMDPVLRIEQELLRHRGVVFDRFGPPSGLEWTRRFNREGYSIHDEINSVGANAMAHLLGDSFRETAVAILPMAQWQTFGDLLLGSIGNTAEERSETISASYRETDQTWREEVRQDGPLRYGVRPWRADPYAYFGARVGHWGGLENLPICIFEARVGYKLFHAGKLEGRLTLPLPHHFQLVGGISTDPFRLATHAINPMVMSARLEYVFYQARAAKVLYAGVESGAGQSLVAGGFMLAW